MRVRIKRFNKDLPLPKKHSEGASAFDLTAREDIQIPAGKVGYIPLNIAVETPPGYFLMLVARSGSHKKGLMLANGIGIVDSDYCGDNDECIAAYFNFTDKPVIIPRGERIAQGMFIKFEQFEWDEAEKLENKTRGGFGSTGHK